MKEVEIEQDVVKLECLVKFSYLGDILSTRFVGLGKPEGVINVFLTYFDNFSGGFNTNLGVLRGTRRGVKPVIFQF